MPRTLLQKVGVLFPYTNFLRLDNEMEMTSTCGGVSALIAILLVIALFINELVVVFGRTRITATSESQISLEPPMVNISTFQNATGEVPYMVAFKYFGGINYNSTAVISAFDVHVQGLPSSSNRTTTKTSVTLESCTAQHFSVVPDIQQKQDSWGISSWSCLPLDNTWAIGGDFELSSDYRRLQVNMTCTNSSNRVDCGYYKVYTLNTFINPSDPVHPMTFYISQDTLLVKDSKYYEYSSKLNQNNLTIDESLTPLAQLVSTNTFEAQKAVNQIFINKAAQFATMLKIQNSGVVTNYTRSFYKLLSALSFVGGIFNSILAIFFFMLLFMRFMFEMRFAEYYFNNDAARDVGFFSWLRQAFFSVVRGTRLQPDWDVTEKRLDLRETVNKVLDIFYLHKRIAFTEKAISVILDRHQLKGLHLSQNLTKEESDRRYQNYKLRDRVVYFLNKHTKATNQEEGKQKEFALGKKGSSDGVLSSSSLSDNKELRGQTLMANRRKGIQHEAEIDGYEDEDIRRERLEVEKIMAQEVRNIGEMEDEELDEDGLADELSEDIKLLFEDADKIDGDERSKRICEMLEGWLKTGLKRATKEQLFTNHIIRRLANEGVPPS